MEKNDLLIKNSLSHTQFCNFYYQTFDADRGNLLALYVSVYFHDLNGEELCINCIVAKVADEYIL